MNFPEFLLLFPLPLHKNPSPHNKIDTLTPIVTLYKIMGVNDISGSKLSMILIR